MADTILRETFFNKQVVRLTLNAPKANVLDSVMMVELQAELESLKSQNDVKLLQLTGTGDNFSFGASVAEHTREKAPKMLADFHKLFYTLMELSIPTMALVSGQCLGGGLEVVLFCHIIFADESARLGQPEISLGVFPPPASLMLPMKVGQSIADDLLITGRTVKGSEAYDMKLVTSLFADRESMLTSADAWVEKHILPKSASSLRFAVEAARIEFNKTLRAGLKELEELYLSKLMTTADANEGIGSFLERRKPEWQNR